MSGLRPFQIALLVGFAVLALFSLVLISNFSPSGSDEEMMFGNRVVIWGTLPYQQVVGVMDEIESQYSGFDVVQYVPVEADKFQSQFVNAIAEGRSPDLVIIPHTELVAQRSKLRPIPYSTSGFSERSLRDTYIDGATIFARSDGVYAVPLAVDPLILFWNRDMFAGAGLVQAPTTWEAIVNTIVPNLTVRNTSRDIIQSAIAFGEFRNIRNAAAILSMLMIQSGSEMVTETPQGYVVGLNESIGGVGRPPMESATQFYTDFATPSNPLYSWNRAQREDRLEFIAGELAMYFGYGSEVTHIADRNPNLNFDVALPPQGANATINRTYGVFYGMAIPRAAANAQGAFAAARVLGSPTYASMLSNSLNLGPVHRTVAAAGADDAVAEVVYDASVTARGWLSPTQDSVVEIFQQMVEDIISNRARASEAVSDAIDRLTLAY